MDCRCPWAAQLFVPATGLAAVHWADPDPSGSSVAEREMCLPACPVPGLAVKSVQAQAPVRIRYMA